MPDLCIDTQGYNSKPGKNEIANISGRIAQYRVDYPIPFIADTIGNKGHTFTPALFHDNKRKKESFLSMQVYALDFDAPDVTYQSVKDRASEYALPFAFSYKTFNYTENLERFRIVFILDAMITDVNIAEMILHMFMKLFPDCDRSCKDVSRMFFGGVGLLDCHDQLCPLPLLFKVFQRQMYIQDSSRHFNRDLQNFCRKFGVYKDKRKSCIPLLVENMENAKNGAYVPESYYIYKELGTNAPKFYILPKDTLLESVTTFTAESVPENASTSRYTEPDLRLHSDYLSKATEICPLLRDAIQDIRQLDHNSCFGLLTNLLNIDGGEKLFRNLISSDETKDIAKWSYDIIYARKNGYAPMYCREFCKYHHTCQHAMTLVQTISRIGKFTVLNTKTDYCSLEEAEEDLRFKFQEAIKADDVSIHVLEAQTAIGKTQIYCDYIRQHYDAQRFFIAVPTLLLKNEVAERLKELGVPVLTAPSVNEFRYIETSQRSILLRLLERGYSKEVRKKALNLLKGMYKADPDFIEKDNYKKAKQELEHYLHFSRQIKNPHVRVIVSTHSQLLHMSEDVLEGFQIIVDEDILKTICLAQRHITVSDIQNLVGYWKTTDVQKKQLTELLNLPIGKPSLFRQEIEPFSAQVILSRNIHSDFNGLRNGCIVYRTPDSILYYYPYRLINKKIIILSASANKDVYNAYFSPRRVNYSHCKEASIQGRILQFHKYSCSRMMIQKTGYKKIKAAVKAQIKSCSPKKNRHIPFITFKSYAKNKLYFGNTEGLNTYENCDIAVLGTPYMNETAYYMLAFAIDHNVTIEKAMPRSITYNGVRFLFMTYQNVLLQKIQEYLISSELEQAVGRARALRNTCTVYVFSSFPVKQAYYIDNDYLKDESQDFSLSSR